MALPEFSALRLGLLMCEGVVGTGAGDQIVSSSHQSSLLWLSPGLLDRFVQLKSCDQFCDLGLQHHLYLPV